MNGSGRRFPACLKMNVVVPVGLLAGAPFALNKIVVFPAVSSIPAGR